MSEQLRTTTPEQFEGSSPSQEEKEIIPDSKVGLSLSFCIGDILRAKVAETEVKEIIASTKAETPEDWEKLIESYKETYWNGDPDRAEAICRRFLEAGKIRQPRTEGKKAHNIAEGHWLGVDQVESWEKQQSQR